MVNFRKIADTNNGFIRIIKDSIHCIKNLNCNFNGLQIYIYCSYKTVKTVFFHKYGRIRIFLGVYLHFLSTPVFITDRLESFRHIIIEQILKRNSFFFHFYQTKYLLLRYDYTINIETIKNKQYKL